MQEKQSRLLRKKKIMNEITLDEILVAALDAEFSQYNDVPERIFLGNTIVQ